MKYTEKKLTPSQVINKIKEFSDDEFVLSLDRDKNEDTMTIYDISTDDIIYYIRQLTLYNKPHCIKNNDKRYKTDYLYEFQKNMNVVLKDNDGNDKLVSMYFKIGFHRNKHIIYGVSFHEDDLIR